MSPKQIKALVFVILILLSGVISFLYVSKDSKDRFLETYTYAEEMSEQTKEEQLEEAITKEVFSEKEAESILKEDAEVYSEEFSSERNV